MMHPVAIEAEKQRIALLVEGQPFRQWTIKKPVVELHQGFVEQRRIHRLRRVDNRPEAHQCENVALDIDARRDLDQFETIRGKFENAPFRHIEHRLPVACGQGAGKRDLIDLADEFRDFPSLSIFS